MERVAKCRDVEILKICAAHIPNKETFNATERFIERAALNNLEVCTFVFERWATIQITATVFERVVKDADVEVVDLFLEKFHDFPLSTRILVAAAGRAHLETFRKILDRAKQQSLIPNDEVIEATFARTGPPGLPPGAPPPPGYLSRMEMVKLVLEANKDCLTENSLQIVFRPEMSDIEVFKLIFLHRLWPPGLIQTEFRSLMRSQRAPIAKVKFLLEQEIYDLKISPATFNNAAEYFDEYALRALFESPRTKGCAVGPDLLDTILRGTVSHSSTSLDVPRGAWYSNRIDTSVFQKMKTLLDFREVEITLKHVLQAQSLKRGGRQIIQLFLDSPDKAKMTEDVRKYAESLSIVKELTFKLKPLPAGEGIVDDNAQAEHRVPGSGYPSGPPSVYSDDDSDSVSSYSSSSDGAAHSLDTLDDSDKRSRENEHPLTYHSLPFESYKSGIAVEPAWTPFVEPAVVEHGA
ncbi:hypothetical protein N431DRAFT_345003 [Stipitochalara longipes BDJ]|nr:hypothetical protein N431DRAFT_345003 [Stipitochalara longipes BDJ]